MSEKLNRQSAVPNTFLKHIASTRYRVKYVSYSHTIILHFMYKLCKIVFQKLKYIYEFIHQRYNTTNLCLPIEGTVAEAKAPEAQ